MPPFDPSDRFTYWVRRLARGGDVLAPGRPDRIVRLIDARDLAAFMVRQVEARAVGVFNTSGADGVTMQGMLDACARAAARPARLRWATEAFLIAHGVTPWSDLPLWLLEQDNALLEAGNAKAVSAGLTFRPLDQTAADTLAWDRTRGTAELRAGLSAAREAELLAALAQSP